jgi:L,D-transpeptidase ErfK/SrfK
MKSIRIKTFFLSIFLIFFNLALALKFDLPTSNQFLLGEVSSHQVTQGETIASIARQYDLGYYELLQANPHVNPKSLIVGTQLVIPSQFLLPNVPREGLIINLGTMRLYYFPKGQNVFYTYPVGIGKQDWSTPLGHLSIIEKIPNPVWRVPKSIYEYRKQQGDPVPVVMPAGPDNPLGEFALRLSKPTYLIHGTNEPDSVGVRSSAGCIHLYPEDIRELFALIPKDEGVLVINEPYQAAWDNGVLYLQAFLPLAEQRQSLADNALATQQLLEPLLPDAVKLNWQKAIAIVQDHSGLPTPVVKIKKQT